MPFKPSGRKRIKLKLEAPRPLKLTSMIDLFTIILIFLLKSYSAVELNVTPSKFLSLPNSLSTKMPIEAVMVTVAKNAIVVEGRPVAGIDENFEVKGLDPDELIIPNLHTELKKRYDKLVKRAELYKREPPDKVMIQADKEIPYRLLMKVLKTAGEVGFSKIVFLTYQKEETG